MSTPEYEIRTATSKDFEVIRQWLHEEEINELEGNFFCNISVIESCLNKNNLEVLVFYETQLPVAFQADWDILAVKHDCRRRGFGRILATHCIEMARDRGMPGLFIECSPQTSIPFWESLGFKLCHNPFGQSSGKNAYLVLEKDHGIKSCSLTERIIIRFYPQEAQNDPGTAHLLEWKGAGLLFDNSEIILPERVTFFNQLEPMKDVVVELIVNGETKYRDKAKYQEASEFGFIECRPFWFIDSIWL